MEVEGRGNETPPLSIPAMSISAVFFCKGRVVLINASSITKDYDIICSHLPLLNEC